VSQVHNAASDLAVVQYITLLPLAQHETLSMSQVANTRFSYLKERTPVLLRAVRNTRHLGPRRAVVPQFLNLPLIIEAGWVVLLAI
jgi:hypothetical protein